MLLQHRGQEYITLELLKWPKYETAKPLYTAYCTELKTENN